MDLKKIQEGKMEYILKFSIPAIIAMILTSLINITDGYFAGNFIGKEAIAAINLGLPIVYLFLGMGLMLAVGGSVIAGIRLGAKQKEECISTFNQTIVTTLIMSVAVSLILYIMFEPVMKLLGAKGVVEEYFRQYYLIMLLEFPLMVLNNALGMFIRGEGNPQYYMLISIINVICNAVLDLILVKPMNLGITGLALGSLITAIISLLLLLLYFTKFSKVYKFRTFHFERRVLKDTILNGSSEFIGEMSMCITMYAYNMVILNNVGVDGVTAFTIVGYVSFVFSMIIIGFGQGCSPLISFTHGACDFETQRGIRKISNLLVLGAGVVTILLMYLFTRSYSQVFIKSAEVQEMVFIGARVHVLSFVFAGINTIASFYFTSIGRAKESALISFLRGIFLILICILTLPAMFGMLGVWLSAPVTEAITFLVSFIFMKKSDAGIEVAQKQLSCTES